MNTQYTNINAANNFWGYFEALQMLLIRFSAAAAVGGRSVYLFSQVKLLKPPQYGHYLKYN